MIELSIREFTDYPSTGHGILLDSNGKIRMHYVVSDPDPDIEEGTRGIIAVTLTAGNKSWFVALVSPDDSGSMVGYQSYKSITQYNMIVKYDLKGYSDQAALPRH